MRGWRKSERNMIGTKRKCRGWKIKRLRVKIRDRDRKEEQERSKKSKAPATAESPRLGPRAGMSVPTLHYPLPNKLSSIKT